LKNHQKNILYSDIERFSLNQFKTTIMKISIYVFLVLTLFIFGGCQQKPSSKNNSDLVGIWQNKTVAKSAIEFTENGEYYLRIEGKRLIVKSPIDSTAQQYIYDSISDGINLKIFSKINGDTTKGKLVFLDSNKIKISLINADTILSETEFFKHRE
jgi:hypothetical protein